jgi:hypothetical protein
MRILQDTRRMSSRAWVLFLCLSSMVTGFGWAVTPVASANDGTRVAHARVAVDLESNTCRVLWQGTQ